MGYNPTEQRYNWDLVFNELYAGGKYDNDTYKFSIGLNGLGGAAVQYTSEFFDVVSYNGGMKSSMHFEHGYPVGELKVEDIPSEEDGRGTYIRWKIDNMVFPDTNFKVSMFKDYCEYQAHLNSVLIQFIDEHSGAEYNYQGMGIAHYLAEKIGNKLVKTVSDMSSSEGVTQQNKHYMAQCEVVLAFTEEMSPKRLFFHNTANMRDVSGVHQIAFKSAVLDFFRPIAEEMGVKIQETDYNDYLSCIVSSYSSVTSFYNQTKDAVSDRFIYDLIYNSVKKILSIEYAKGTEEMLSFVESVKIACQARIKAKLLEQAERKAKKVTNARRKPDKFKDCARSTKPEDRELYIVEGDSALGACKQSRDSRFQALIPVQGKILNCLKASVDRILDSEIISDLTSVIGTGIDLGDSSASFFDIDNLQFDKVIICTDADVDGFQIRVLLYCMFYRLMPELLRQGKVYIVETPLFELVTNKGSVFAYTVEEKDELLVSLQKQGIVVKSVNRSKGLGENDEEMMRVTTMQPETRRLVQLNIDIREQIIRDISNILFGSDVYRKRKEFVRALMGVQLAKLVETLTDEDMNMEEHDDAVVNSDTYN